MSVAIRNLTPADIGEADVVVMAAYGRNSAKTELERYLRLQPDGWFGADVDGRIAGMVGTLVYGPFAYVGMMAVHPSAQRRGIAAVLMHHLLARVEQAGCPTVLLDATEAGAPLYVKCGFVETDKVHVYRLEHTPDRRAPSPVVAPVGPEHLDEIVRFDAGHFGAERGAMLSLYMGEFAGRTFATRDTGGALTGYVLTQPSGRLGPWVANDAGVAETLLDAARGLAFDGPLDVLIPGASAAGVDLLSRRGFFRQRTLRHMRRGGTAEPRRRETLFGQASFATG
jgi:GNAT superfamily N-acetyltransferase